MPCVSERRLFRIKKKYFHSLRKERVMVSFDLIGNFFLSIWLWNVTFGLTHILVGIPLFCCLLFFVCHYRLIPAIVWGTGSYATSFALLSLIAMSSGYYVYHQPIAPITITEDLVEVDVIRASILLAVLYSIFQTIFFIALQGYMRRPSFSPYITIIITNGISLYVSYLSIRIFMWYLY